MKATKKTAGGKIKPPREKIAKELVDKILELEKNPVKIGWFESAKYESGVPVAYVASIQEFGWGPIPPRSFMRSTASERQKEWAVAAEKLAYRVSTGKTTPANAMEVIGQVVSGDIRKKISEIKSPPLSIVTLLARKARMEGEKIGGKKIGELAKNASFIGPRKEDDKTFDVTGVPTKPLVFDGILIGTLTYVVGSEGNK